ncbi:hypothetical protein F7725_006417 [Dissostichus mawsoni]|uniref:Uncharacterized protein n=1 Tax=Dissostichus mawsoni TaxID=36200 RepID=A0A7J5XTV6_DISMA|nr:hypothetical protein F7725_006417 [Dissostichus mawsoni]
MNPLTKVKLINELNDREASLGVNESVSWHTEYKDSAWVFVGGFPYELNRRRHHLRLLSVRRDRTLIWFGTRRRGSPKTTAPQDSEDMDDITKSLREQGCAPKLVEVPPPSSSSGEEEE